MLTIDPTISDIGFNKLQVLKLSSEENCETLLVSLEKGHAFPEHTSPRDALLVLLEGEIVFSIQNEEYQIQVHQTFKCPALTPHKVYSRENSKFLIIR